MITTKRAELTKIIENIKPADSDAMARARRREDSLAKPPGSLGELEEIAIRLAGILDDCTSDHVRELPDPDCVIVFCADNGVAAQGVSSAPQSVTRAQTINFTRRLTGVGALAKSFGCELLIVDMGVADTIPDELYEDVALKDTHKIIDRRIRPGTWDISEKEAMTEAEAVQAMLTGVEMACAAADAGYGILGIGEMGIGNTTTTAAVLSALTGEGSEITCGRGGGINDASYKRKLQIVNACTEDWRREGGLLRRYPIEPQGNPTGSSGRDRSQGRVEGTFALKDVAEEMPASGLTEGAPDSGLTERAPASGLTERAPDSGLAEGAPDSEDPGANDERLEAAVALLASCGGFDLAAMTGAYLGAAMCRIPVVIDGYISAVAALVAAMIEPNAVDYMFASHKSAEPGYELAVRILGLKPFLDLDMRLGEGSGCPIAFAVIRGARDVFRNMGTFKEAHINDDYLEEIRRGGCF